VLKDTDVPIAPSTYYASKSRLVSQGLGKVVPCGVSSW